MKTAHRRQSRAKQALRQMDLLEFFYPSPSPDDRDEVDVPEPPKGPAAAARAAERGSMKERASWPMKDWEVRAILSGKKTQTRRAVRFTDSGHVRLGGRKWHIDDKNSVKACPYGQPGDQLWVREAFEIIHGQTRSWIDTDYRATYIHGDRLGDAFGVKKQWTSATHMTKEVSRITLELTGVRVERLQDISEADAIAEGVTQTNDPNYFSIEGKCLGLNARESYANLWESINGTGSIDANPWVWVVEFKRIRGAA